MKLIQKLLFDITEGILHLTLFNQKQYKIAMINAMQVSHATINEDLFLELNSYEGMEGALEFGQRYMRYLTPVDAEKNCIVAPTTPLEVKIKPIEVLTKEIYSDLGSSFVEQIEYYPQVEVMVVTLESGNTYNYWVEREYLEDFLVAPSKGKYYNSQIKGNLHVVSFGFVENTKKNIVDGAEYYVVINNSNFAFALYVYTLDEDGDASGYASIATYDTEIAALEMVTSLPF